MNYWFPHCTSVCCDFVIQCWLCNRPFIHKGQRIKPFDNASGIILFPLLCKDDLLFCYMYRILANRNKMMNALFGSYVTYLAITVQRILFIIAFIVNDVRNLYRVQLYNLQCTNPVFALTMHVYPVRKILKSVL